MNSEVLFLFLILLFGLLGCSFLGDMYKKEGMKSSIDNTSDNSTDDSDSNNTNYDNYNHFNKTSSALSSGSTFYGSNGGTVIVGTNTDGSQTLTLTLAKNQTPIILSQSKEGYTNYSGSSGSATKFYGPNNTTATVVDKNGQTAIKIKTQSGTTIFTEQGVDSNSTSNSNVTTTQYYGSTGNYASSTHAEGPYGGSAGSVTGPQGNTASYAQGPAGNTVAGTDPYYSGATQYDGPSGGSTGSATGPHGNTAYYAQGPSGNTVAGTSTYNPYGSSALAPGIPRTHIPHGQEDLYILKSQIVPPVCPVCPIASSVPRQEPCAACPPCGRCPEPSFECKKVPNYNAISDQFLPAPIVNSFASF
jgi:hypothetical protein